MRLIILMGFTLWCFQGLSQDWTNKSRLLPDDLRKVPVAIYIIHGPNPNYPELSSETKSNEFKYVWRHSTSVISPQMDLEVVKAGSFIWFSENGWMNNVEYNKRQFERQFNCPKGILKAGIEYTFEKNYRWGNDLYGGDALWYVIAKDKNGNLYKGIGLLETESEIINKLKNDK